MLGRLDVGAWRPSTTIEAPVDKWRNLHLEDATTKYIVFSQFVDYKKLDSLQVFIA